MFSPRDSHAEATYGLEWQHALLAEYGIEYWCLIVDADKWFIYPGYEDKPLPDLAAYLERDAQGMFTLYVWAWDIQPDDRRGAWIIARRLPLFRR